MARFLTKRKTGFGSVWIPSTPLPHMLQLDSLRAFAVLAVLVSHFAPNNVNALQTNEVNRFWRARRAPILRT